LIEELALPRDSRRPPLFDVMVVFQDGGQKSFNLDGLTISPLGGEGEIAKFPLTFEFVERAGRVSLNLEYSTDLFERPRLERLVEHLQNLLAAPEAPLAQIAILSEAERQLVLGTEAATSLDLPPDATVPSQFTALALAHPRHLALLCEEASLTYGALEERSNALAQALIKQQNIKPGDRVGALLERSEALPIAFLGIVKAGGVYVPLDPSYPADRLSFMIEDAGIAALVTEEGLEPVLTTLGHRLSPDKVLSLDHLPAGGKGRASRLPILRPDNLAYMIYTSGSTGQPKGVLLEHRGAVNLALAQRQGLGIGPHHRVLQFAPSSFDASVWEMVMALLNGATLVIAGPERIRDTRAFSAYLRHHKVTIATLPPTYLAQLEDEDLAELKILISAGEAPKSDQALRLAKHLTYINAYGPTETTVCASWHKLDPAQDSGRPLSIGRAIANMEMLVLDPNGALAPIGISGEIHVGGPGLARGYHQRPDLTAAAFIPHPFRPGQRLYRTGDLGQVTPDGNVLLLGRRDSQIKLRGHRVEMEEVERALLRHPKIAKVVISLHHHELGQDLVANILPADPTAGPLAITELRAFLASSLPDYMIPTLWVTLESLPLLPNGKIDYRALPDPLDLGPEEAEWEIPAEALVAGIWRDILRRRDIGRHVPFYELGGDSIKAIQVVGRLRQAGYQIDMRRFLEAPTLAALAARLELAPVPVPEPEANLTHHVSLSTSELEELLGGE